MIKLLIVKCFLGAAAVALGITTSHAAAVPIAIIDDANVTITLKSPARRIATLAPFLTELVYAADAAPHLVAVSAFSDYPEAAKKLPIIADYQGMAIESLLAAKPDLVLAWQTGNRPQDIARIKSLGIPVVQFELKNLEDIPRAMAQIALFTGISKQPTSIAAIADFNERLAALKVLNGSAASARKPTPSTRAHPNASAAHYKIRYFLPIERMPLMTLSGAHIVSKALAVCGGENIFANAAALAPVVDKEGIVAGNPEIIFVSAATLERGAVRVKLPSYDALAKLPITAIQNKDVFGLNADWLMRPTPRMLGAVESACAAMSLVRENRAALPE